MDCATQKLHDTGRMRKIGVFRHFFIFSGNLRLFSSKYSLELLGKVEVHRVTYFKTNNKGN